MAGPQRATNHPDYSSGSASRFIPEIWSGKLIEKLYDYTCLAEISNTDYEGEIKQKGDKVVIRTTPTMVIKDHKTGQKLEYDTPESDSIELNVDQAKYFAFRCEDVDAYQSDLNLINDWSDDAGQQMQIEIDTSVMARFYADASPENAGDGAGRKSGGYNMGAAGAPVALNKTSILDYIVDAGSVLDEQNVPNENRWIVLPSWANGMLKKSDLRDASVMGDAKSVFRNGKVGELDRFTVYINNNLSMEMDANGNQVTHIPFGHKKSLTFASQMTEMDQLKDPYQFGQLVRGLNVYGWKVIDPKAMGHMVAARG